VEEISIATQQQRSASDQVVVAMTQVSEVSRQYAAGSKQTAAASAQIATLAAAMQDSISTFRVEDVSGGEWDVSRGASDDDEAEVVWPDLDDADDPANDDVMGGEPSEDDQIDRPATGEAADEGLTV
jgi:hypothetical protein